MDSGRNPQLADILWRLKNPSEAATEPPPHSIAAFDRALPDSTIVATRSSSPSNQGLAAVDPRQRSTTRLADPSKITTWPAAQKYVIDTIYRSESLTSKIKQLIKNQHDQERQWWAEREALSSKHRGRVEKEKQIAAMLQSMGGIATTAKAPSSGEEEDELNRCNLKIHKAMTKLATDVDRELRAMGVPFYAIKHELVNLEKPNDGRTQLEKIDKSELKELQKRMLQLLEDLFKD